MSVVKQIREPRADYRVLEEPVLLRGFELLTTAEGGVAKLRELILSLAVQGKLVTQDTSNETAEALLLRLWKHHPETSARHALSHDARTAPYQLPKTWAWAALGDLVESVGSGWSPACNEGKRIDGRRWAVLRTTAVQVMKYRPDEHKTLPLKLTPRPDIEVKRGDILMTRAGPMNRVGISCAVNETPPRLMLSDKIVRFHPINGELLPAFVVLALNAGWSREQLEQAKTGMAASQVNISQAHIKKVLVPICDTAEQHRIVARVEELMTLCDELEARGRLADEQHARLTTTLFDALTASDSAQTLADNWQRIAAHFDLLLDRPQAIDALEQTILQLAVRGLLVPQDASDEPASKLLACIRAEKDRLIADGKIKHNKPQPGLTEATIPSDIPSSWQWARLGDVVELISGQHLTPNEYSEQPDLGIPYLTGPAEFGAASPDPTRWTTTRRAVAKRGDILITVKGAGVGKLNTVSQPELAISRQLMAIRPSGLLPAFIFLFLKTMYDTFQAKAVGIAIPGIGRDDVLNAALAIPPLAEQHRIVVRVEHLCRLCADLRERLNKVRAIQTHLAEALVTEAVQP